MSNSFSKHAMAFITSFELTMLCLPGFQSSGHPAVPPELDLVESEDQITHELSIDSEINSCTSLDVFKVRHIDVEYYWPI